MEILVLGAENVGKTLLVKSIRELLLNKTLSKMAYDGITPTVGVNIMDLTLPGNEAQNIASIEPINFKVRELGSAIALKWFTYFDQCDAVVFLIDISDISTWSSSMVFLHETYTFLHAQHNQRKAKDGNFVPKPVLLLLTKTDLTDSMTISAGMEMMGINQLIINHQHTDKHTKENNRPPALTTIHGSCYSEEFVQQVLNWISTVLRLA